MADAVGQDESDLSAPHFLIERHRVRYGVHVELGRSLDRDADTRAYYITAPILGEDVRALPPEQLFTGSNVAPDANVFQLGSPSAGGSLVWTRNKATAARISRRCCMGLRAAHNSANPSGRLYVPRSPM